MNVYLLPSFLIVALKKRRSECIGLSKKTEASDKTPRKSYNRAALFDSFPSSSSSWIYYRNQRGGPVDCKSCATRSSSQWGMFNIVEKQNENSPPGVSIDAISILKRNNSFVAELWGASLSLYIFLDKKYLALRIVPPAHTNIWTTGDTHSFVRRMRRSWLHGKTTIYASWLRNLPGNDATYLFRLSRCVIASITCKATWLDSYGSRRHGDLRLLLHFSPRVPPRSRRGTFAT